MIFCRRAVLALALLAVPTLPVFASAAPLPAQMTLQYRVHYGDLLVGSVVKTLQRQRNGDYGHSTSTRPTGIAKIFTDVEFVEQGTFRLHDGQLEPLTFADTKTGGGHGYVRQVTFDYRTHRLEFKGHPTKPMPPGTQDLNTIFYLFMLDPVRPGMKRLVYVTNGKNIEPYWFVYRRTEEITTPWGRVKTYLVSRMSKGDWQAEQRCPSATPACQHLFHGFEIWVAPNLHDIAVKLTQIRHGHKLTLTLDQFPRRQ